MQTTLKLKLHNALNSVNFTDADSPALIVGGRRRNRKKRRSRHGQNRRKNRRGDSNNNSPAETPESPRKSFINLDYSKPQQPKVSCLDIEEPIFAVSTKINTNESDNCHLFNSKEYLIDSTAEDKIFEEEDISDSNDHGDKGFRPAEITNADDLTEIYETENKTVLLRHHSEDSGVFDYEEEWNQQNMVTLEDTDSALSENESDGPENVPSQETDTCESLITAEAGYTDGGHAAEEQTKNAIFEEVPIDDENEDVENSEEVIFDLTDLRDKSLKTSDDDISPLNNSDKFQLKSSIEPTELEDETPQQIPLDLLSDDEDDVVLFDAGSRSEPGIICNPLYEQSLKEEQDLLVRSYQVGFKPDFDAVNFIRLPATDKAAKKEMKETSPLIGKESRDELPCCVIL